LTGKRRRADRGERGGGGKIEQREEDAREIRGKGKRGGRETEQEVPRIKGAVARRDVSGKQDEQEKTR